MAKKKQIEKAWKLDEKGRKYLEFDNPSIDINNGNISYITEREYPELGGTWALMFLVNSIKKTNGMARRTLEEMEGLTEEEIRCAYINDRNHGGNEYLELIKLGEILKKASE